MRLGRWRATAERQSIADSNYEADDIIASLARLATSLGFDVVIVAGDKDLMQCVDEHVMLFDPVLNKRTRIDGVKEKFGVGPSSVVDVQGLMGDSIDNIPGVRGVGPKTATALIQHFGSVERVYENLEEIDVRTVQELLGHRDVSTTMIYTHVLNRGWGRRPKPRRRSRRAVPPSPGQPVAHRQVVRECDISPRSQRQTGVE